MGTKVLLDSNSLIYSIKQRTDIRDLLFRIPEITGILVPECVLEELRRMSADVQYARGALQLARSFETIGGTGPADDCLLKLASEGGFFILTNDRELLGRVRKSGIRALSFKQKRIIDYSW